MALETFAMTRPTLIEPSLRGCQSLFRCRSQKPDVGIWTECEREILAAFADVRLLRATPQDALASAQRRLDKSWTRHRRSLERHGQLPPADLVTAP